jgi:hypothetical protein
MVAAERLAGLEQERASRAITKAARRDGAPIAELDISCLDMNITTWPTPPGIAANPAWALAGTPGNGDRVGRHDGHITTATDAKRASADLGAPG